jgi:hypothetical protein
MKKILYVGFISLLLVSCTVTYPGIATGNEAIKTGISEKTVWFGIAIRPVDVSVEKAAKNGGITKIATMDYSMRNGLFRTTYKTIVTGN